MNSESPVSGWRSKAGPALALVAAGVVAGAIMSSSVSASAADDGSATPSPSSSSTTDPGAAVEGGTGAVGKDGKLCEKGAGRRGAAGGEQMRQFRGGPGGSGHGRLPDQSGGSTVTPPSTQAPSGAATGSPASYLTF